MNSGVYKITNKLNGYTYVGSTSNFNERWKSHYRCLCNGNHSNSHLQHAWNKDGECMFKFSVVEYVDEGPAAWIAREQYYTDLWNPEYAIRKECVTSNFGIKRSEETKQKMREAQKGEKSFMYGSHLSEETKQKLRRYRHSDERKRKISLALKGRISSNKGHKLSDETKRKMSIALSGVNNPFYGKHHSEETKQKLRKPRSEETRRKMSIAATKRWAKV